MQVAHDILLQRWLVIDGNLPCPGSHLIYSLQQWTAWAKEHRI